MKDSFANIIVDISHEKVDRPFQYRIPDALRGKISVGMSVIIPFGKANKPIKGYVMEITDQAQWDIDKIKYISDIVEGGISAEGESLQLAWWIKENYGATMISAIKTVLPVKKHMKQIVKKTICCKLTKEDALNKSQEYERKHQKAKARLLKELSTQPLLPQSLVTGKLNISSSTISALEKDNLIEVRAEGVYRNTLPKNVSYGWQNNSVSKKQLSSSQQAIVTEVVSDFKNQIYNTYLLHGVTGSGKTEVYMEIIESIINEGKQAIMLIPEIALTYQTLIRFYQRFGERVSVMNSKLSQGERSDQFERAKKGEIDIMIGPRSALFTPFKNLGLIIIDEEHESSYKSENMPKYHARDVARQLCRIKNASLILGSATPSLEVYYRAKRGEIRLFELKERLAGGQLPKVYIEDLRKELKSGNRSIFSRRLQALIDDRLQKGEQTMLFINRRGYAGFVSCRSCGYVIKCPHCDVSLSEHSQGYGNNSIMVCHYCGYTAQKVSICPECGSKYILGFKAGTQQIEETLNKMFPTARVLRMDADTTRNKDSYEEILSKFANEEADILIGTQMIVKGHDFAKVTLVGVLAADMSLHSGDYRAGERTFQLLTQAAGRAGRSLLNGEVVIQTYQPDNNTIIHAANQDYEGFYEEEIVYRDLMCYPPVVHMMAVLILSSEELTGTEHANILANIVKMKFISHKPQIIGPSVATVGKINDVYRNIFFIKHKDYNILIKIKDELESYINETQWSKDSVQFDFNPLISY